MSSEIDAKTGFNVQGFLRGMAVGQTVEQPREAGKYISLLWV